MKEEKKEGREKGRDAMKGKGEWRNEGIKVEMKGKEKGMEFIKIKHRNEKKWSLKWKQMEKNNRQHRKINE